MQERDDLRILHAGASDLMSYLAGPNAPAAQRLALILRGILYSFDGGHELFLVVHQDLSRQPHGLRDGLMAESASPVFDDGFPSHAVGHLIEDIRNQYTRPAKSRLSVAYVGINYNETPDGFGHVFDSSLDGRYHSQRVSLYYTGREAADQTNPSW